ncbi:tyrosine-protein phosphatase 69D [Nilaparvata lugens]|uniref:tyrosine-protein phosphatase 69D n=1 Tax=Nilaparvata lugens TaxID=108931 RepID=UPI00193CC436|nr:tyrosine-protein phosphatase 69D [Nilaparvata lugens]
MHSAICFVGYRSRSTTMCGATSFIYTLIIFSKICQAFGSPFDINDKLIEVVGPSNVQFCDNVTITCKTRITDAKPWWSFSGTNLTEDGSRFVMETNKEEGKIIVDNLHILCVTLDDIGNYTCHTGQVNPENKGADNETVEQSVFLQVNMPGVVSEVHHGRKAVGGSVKLRCIFSGSPISDITWTKGNDSSTIEKLRDRVEVVYQNQTCVETTLELLELNTRKDNGTYYCSALIADVKVSAPVHLFILDSPQVKIDVIKVVGANRIFLNWTVNNGNDPVRKYYIQFLKNGTEQWTYYQELIGAGNTSYVIKNLEANTAYRFKLSAENSIGQGNTYTATEFYKTLEKDPDFVPEISLKGTAPNGFTIGWSLPPLDIKDHVHYYQLVLYNNYTKKEAIHPAESINSFMFGDLQSATTYYFKVAACNEYTQQCGNWSKEIPGTTMDGVSGPPQNVNITCKFDEISKSSAVGVTWDPPSEPNGKIVHYNVVLHGSASYRNEKGDWEEMTWGPKIKSVDASSNSAVFDMIPPNTNYSVKVAGVTRTRGGGTEATGHCSMPPTIPDKEKLARFHWDKVEEQGRWLLKLSLPRISERNGPICCYRVFVVKLRAQQNVADLPPPQFSPVSSYQEVHHGKSGGAYVADMFDSNSLNSDIFLGDGQTLMSAEDFSNPCHRCIGLKPNPPTLPTQTTAASPTNATAITVTTNTTSNATTPQSAVTSPIPNATVAHALNFTVSPTAPTTKITTTSVVPSLAYIPSLSTAVDRARRSVMSVPATTPHTLHVFDGQLDTSSNYTGFIEIIVFGGKQVFLPAYSSYFEALNPGPQVLQAIQPNPMLNNVLQVACVLLFVILVLVVVLYLLQRYTKQVAEAQGVEMSLRNSFRHLCRSLRGSHLPVSNHPPDMSPILAADLATAFGERHKDSDYGFQHEFELLPDGFNDRTTKASEARENMYKNRYPDIKAYDQTRVKLSQVDSIAGSDYINANFVIGYKERKKFICAQGPMDNTVCDFWRMIWEQHLELILMLTNLEEYSKTKCAKYWADKAEGEKNFGDITVSHVNEKRYSDYIFRELKMVRNIGSSREERSIIQYHFLVWKDFQAPEHPAGILKFIKRVNEAYSLEKGPILVHCSAGVGRTGTLVALDSLLQQLAAENQVAIFNTVCDLRHQRNFLVQSLKQYIFVYRALLEVAQFGDTELKASKLKASVEKLKQLENGKEKSKLEEEFEKICRVVEERKSNSVGSGEENCLKNRSELVIPYDRNRVILTPVLTRDHSTYINASFIEGYDNSESFIITQDPLDCTYADFWRMVCEQNISTLVMLSDLGESAKKCPRYWPDDEILHDHVKVKYIQSESCPYYTRRELCVTNIKTDDKIMVTQYQYNGWPTVEGEVPEVTRGLLELVDQTQGHIGGNNSVTNSSPAEVTTAPILVHCHCGSDRSSMFVALSILVQQLRIERRVDICTTVRKLRSQRQGMIQAYAQYEFLHRAIVNYADLHHLSDEESNCS